MNVVTQFDVAIEFIPIDNEELAARLNDEGLELANVPRLVLEKRFHDNNLSHAHPELYRREMVMAFRHSVARKRAGQNSA